MCSVITFTRPKLGSIEIMTSPEQAQDVATVQVIVTYFRESARDEAKVCWILRGDGAPLEFS